MRKRMKATFAVAMSIVMAAGMMGCGQQNAPAESAAPEKMESSNVTAEQPAESQELEVVKILGRNYTYTGANGRTVTLKDWSTEGKSARWEKLTEELAARGIKLELDLIEPDQYTTTCQTMAASGEFSNYDLINMSPLDEKTRINLVKQGQLQSISDVWEQYSEGTAKEFFATEAGEYFYNHLKLEDGKCYWISDFGSGTYKDEVETNSVLGFQLRQDWLDKIGRDIPTSLDELYDVMTEFQEQDVNKSGAKDEIICLELGSFSSDIAQWFGLGIATTFINSQDNNTVTSPWYQENVKDYIQYMQKLYAAGLLKNTDPQYTQYNTYMASNQIAGIAEWATEMWLEPSITVPEGEAYPWYVPFRLEAVKGQTPLYRGQNKYNPSSRAYAIPASSDKQEAIAKILDYLISEEGINLTEFGVEDVSYKVVDGKFSNLFDGTLENTDAVGCSLWTNNSIFPRFELNKDISVEMVNTIQFGEDNGVTSNVSGKHDFTLECTRDQEHRLFHDETAYAVPTLDELKRIGELSSDLQTYSSELLTKLIMGEKSLDDWDSYIQDLKDLGLDELIAINQGRCDRALK